MGLQRAGQSVLQKLFTGYLKLLEKTVRVQWNEDRLYGSSQIFGFWHEDSFFMNLVLKELAGKTAPVDVVVTADTRGDYIEYMIKKCGGSAVRIPDGYGSFKALKALIQRSYEQTRSLAVALDGPLGPRHEPKKLAFYLSEQSGEDFVGITVNYSACLRLFWRWDQYAVPLPFSTVNVDVKDYGEVSKRNAPELPVRAGLPVCAGQPICAEQPVCAVPTEQPVCAAQETRRGASAGRMIRDALRYSKTT